MSLPDPSVAPRGRLHPSCWWIPGLALGLYLTVMAFRLQATLTQIYRHGDAPAIPLMAEAWRAGRGPVLTATQTSIISQTYDALIARTGLFNGLVMAFGPVVTVAAALTMWRGARRAMSGGGAWLTLVLALAIPPAIVWADFAQDNHVMTVFGTALLGWHLVVMGSPGPQRRGLRSVLVGLGAGVILVDDPQMLASAVLPFMLATLLVWRLDRRAGQGLLRNGVVTLALMTLAGVVGPTLMESAGIKVIPAFKPALSLEGIRTGLSLGARGLVWMTGGGWYGAGWGVSALIGIVATVGLVALPIVVLRKTLRRSVAKSSPGRVCHAVFWTFSGLGIAASFLAAGDSHIDIQAHYVIGIFYAAAALMAHLGSADEPRALRWIAVIMATVVATAAAVGVARLDPQAYTLNAPDNADQAMAAELQAHGLLHGYAGYWDAYDVTWKSGGVLDIWPVISGPDCQAPSTTALCPYGTSTALGAYSGRAQAPTFVIVRGRSAGCVHQQPDDGIFGPPSTQLSAGDLTAYVYNYDVATRFSPNHAPLCTGD